jgi:hypothetical protein
MQAGRERGGQGCGGNLSVQHLHAATTNPGGCLRHECRQGKGKARVKAQSEQQVHIVGLEAPNTLP